jgi:hypothetical protein
MEKIESLCQGGSKNLVMKGDGILGKEVPSRHPGRKKLD